MAAAAAAAAAVLSFRSISHLASSVPFDKQSKLRKPVLSLTEIADKSTPFSSLPLTVSSITFDGNRRGSRPAKSSASGRNNGDESNRPSDGIKASNSSRQEEIIALFRRIQSSISKNGTGRAKTRSFSSSKDKSTAQSVLDVLRESKNVQQDSRPKKGGKALRWKSGVPKKRQEMGERAAAATQDFTLSRPPSNFVKRSPIPQPTAPRGKNPEQNNEIVVTNIEKLKLPELKELAKARGIKGYSKLKKSELVQLLK